VTVKKRVRERKELSDKNAGPNRKKEDMQCDLESNHCHEDHCR